MASPEIQSHRGPLPPEPSSKLSGFSLLLQQLSALLIKNVLLSMRSKRATALQLVSSLFFIFLIFCVDQSITARRKTTTSFKNLFDPEPTFVTPIPACETGYYIKSPCYDFIWSGKSISKAATIVENIMKNNPNRPIPPSKVMGFATIDEANQWLIANPMRTTGALHFLERSSSVITYGIQTNSTAKQQRGKFEDPTFTFQIPLQLAAEREITRFVTGDSTIEWSVAFKEYAHPSLETFSTVGTIGPIFLLAATMFGFVIQMNNLVTERELKLRQAMSIMGLLDSAYWLSWLLWEFVLALISSTLIVLFGMMFQFYFFLHNNFGVLFFMFFLFQFNMIGFAFMLSAFVRNSASARTVGFSVFIIGFLTELVTVFGFPYDQSFAKFLQVIWSIFPPNLLAIGLQYLGDATATKQDRGISWEGRKSCSFADPNCVLTMDQIYVWLASTFFLWFLLAIYLDNVLKDVNGVKQSFYYFLRPSYWIGGASSKLEEGDVCTCSGSPSRPLESNSVDEDVAAEEQLIKEQAEGPQDPNVAVLVRGLMKTFPGTKECCQCKSTPEYHAVKSLWVHIEKNQLFCLLGPNGAGKTTTINCLTGIVPVTAGDALVYGDSIRSTRGMSNIRSYMGVCPQFDILWDALTGLEHLYLFARIKGLPPSLVKETSAELLFRVKLAEAMNMRAASYSGGMKRRLSVAISLIGDPKIVYLDEPTTGMDPITRRHVWDIIEGAKSGRAIILTTHSMEEADILSDSIAIMAKGKLCCIGTSLYLKSRFGAGFIVTVSLERKNSEQQDENALKIDRMKSFFIEHLGIQPKNENKAFITFVIPREKESQLPEFFTDLQDKEEEFGITDIQVSLATLEEVFLNIAKQAELENAAVEGRYETITLLNGDSLQVPIGADFVAVPDSQTEDHPYGLMIKLQWQQDETGTLCLSNQSDLIPACAPHPDEGFAPVSRTRSRSSRRFGSQTQIPIGRAVEPDTQPDTVLKDK